MAESAAPAGGARSDPLDVVIAGAGPCGLATAVAVKEHGLRFQILDRGCVTHSLTRYPYYMTFFSTAERLEIGDVPFTIPEAKPTRREALAYYRRVALHHGIAVRQHEAVVGIEREPGTGGAGADGFRLRTEGRGGAAAIWTRAVVVATGGLGEPNRLDIPEVRDEYDRRVVHYYTEPYAYFDQDVVVVGGGNSAVEAALDLHRNGVRVRMVHFGTKLDRGVKPWVRPDIDNRIATGEILMHWRSRVAGLGRGTAAIKDHETGAHIEAPCDTVLAMTGWRPNRALLTALGADFDAETGVPLHDPATMETTVPGAYVAGVLAAGFDANKIFIENGRRHGALIAADIARRASYNGLISERMSPAATARIPSASGKVSRPT